MTTDAPTVLFGHLTDVHVVGRGITDELHVDNNARMAAAVAALNAEDPSISAVLATGDLTAWGRQEDYEQLGELLAPLTIPVLAIPGNHDDRDRLRAVFPKLPWAEADHASWVVEIEGVRIIGLDSTRIDSAGAEFDHTRERWLRGVLGNPYEGITLLTLHHPPFQTGIAWMDRAGFVGMDRFATVLREFPVARVLCGHLHRPVTTVVGGVTTQIGLSTIEAVELDLRGDARPRLNLDPVGYGLVAVIGGEVLTHTRYIDSGHRPFEPEWADLYG